MYIRATELLGQTPDVRQPDTVRIILIDPTGIFKNKKKLCEAFRSGLEDKFNRLDPNWLKQAFLKFQVQYRADEPSQKEKAGFRRLDFPVYLLDKQHGSKTILNLMTQHKIPQTFKNQDLYNIAKDCWDQNDTRGCGIPSGDGFRKIGFIKTYRVFQDATGDLWQAFINATAHEIGHMGNRRQHSPKGLMKYPLPLNVAIDFDQGDKYLFLNDLLRLRRLSD